MKPTSTCPVCDTPLPGDAPRGLCPRCVIAEVLAARPAAARIGAGSVARFGDYELLGELAQGGMGTVYYARQASLNRLVALKVIRAGQLASEAEVQRFRTEAEAAANLDHPHIVPVFEVGEVAGCQFFTMKLMEGGTLADWNAGGTARDATWLRQSARRIATVARAVHHAHQRGILHRDLKPTNILLDDAGEPHLTDFGLAKLAQDRPPVTQSLAVLGTPGYMSPEQAAGRAKQLTTATDIYSLGAILFELLTGRVPFQGDSTLAVLKLVQEAEPQRPSRLNPSVDVDLETICLKCLEKEPARRYATAEALAQDLDRWQAQQPIQARPSTSWERGVKWTRRNPVVAALSAAALVSFLAGLTGVLWQWRAARAEAVRADHNAQRADAGAAESRQRLAHSHVANGNRLLAEGSPFDALLYFAEALRLDAGPAAEATHRMRLASVLRQAPRLVQLLRPGAPPGVGSFASDSRRLLVSTDTGEASVWDVETGERVVGPLQHSGLATQAGFLDRHRALLVAPYGGDGVHLYDDVSGAPKRVLAHEGMVSVCCDAAQEWLLTCGSAGDFKLWNLFAPEARPQVLRHPGSEGTADLANSGNVIATAGESSVILWDRRTMQPLFPPLPQDGLVSAVVFNGDDTRLTVVNFHRSFQVWDVKTGQPVAPPVRQRVIAEMKLSPNQKWFAGVANRGTVKVWEAATGQLAFPELRHLTNPGRVEFTPDSRRLLVGAGDGTAYVWDFAREDPEPVQLRNSRRVKTVAANSNATRIATFSLDGFVRVWDCRPRTLRFSPWSRSPGSLVEVGDVHRLLTVTPNGIAQLWDTTTWRPAQPALTLTNPIGRAWLTAGGSRLVVQCVQSNLHLLSPRLPRERGFEFQTWDVPTGRLLATQAWTADPLGRAWCSPDGRALALARAGQLIAFDPGNWQPLWQRRFENPVTGVAFSADSVCAAALAGKEIHLLDVPSGTHRLPPLKVPVTAVYADFSPDGRTLATVSGNSVGGQFCQLWDVATGQPLGPALDHLDAVWCVRFSPDGRRVVTSSTDHSARVWDAQTGAPLTAPMKHGGQINFAAFSPDSRLVVTAGEDATARVWDAQGGEAVTPPLRHPAAVAYATFLADGRTLFTQTTGGQAALWQLPQDSRSPAEWSNLAKLLAARRLNSSGGPEPLDATVLAESFNELRLRDPAAFQWEADRVMPGFALTGLPPAAASNPFRLNSILLQLAPGGGAH